MKKEYPTKNKLYEVSELLLKFNNKGTAEYSELMNYLRAHSDAFSGAPRILIDSALAEKISGKIDEHGSIRVRVYDLDDSRATKVRDKIKPFQVDSHLVLLTLRY